MTWHLPSPQHNSRAQETHVPVQEQPWQLPNNTSGSKKSRFRLQRPAPFTTPYPCLDKIGKDTYGIVIYDIRAFEFIREGMVKSI